MIHKLSGLFMPETREECNILSCAQCSLLVTKKAGKHDKTRVDVCFCRSLRA